VHDGILHVVARGNEKKAIYRDASDRERFLEVLDLACSRYRWRVLAYCLMTNHYHLLCQTPDANLARGMRHLNGVYAQAFNRRHGRDGHVFQGRYSALLVQEDEHLLAAVRYIVRNPLRARLCERVSEWPWSSHRATIGARPPGVVAVERLLGYLGESRAEARRRYLSLVEEDEDPPAPAHPLVDGEEGFVLSRLGLVEPDPEYALVHVRPPRPSLGTLLGSSPDAPAILAAHRRHGYSMRQIALHLGCGLTTVHRRIRDLEKLERGARGGTWKT
jgi:REP element-mobilizing transposase RayT